MANAHLLVVDDEVQILTALQKTLSLEGYEVDVAGGVQVARERLAKRSYDIALFDVALPDGDGVSLLEELRKSGNETPVIMMSGHATIDAAVRATRLGAIDFLEKPLSTDRLLLVIQNTLRLVDAEQETRELRRAAGWVQDMVGSSRAMQVLRDQIARAAKAQASVLVLGERGTGKELVARALHEMSDRRASPMVAVNCSTLPGTLIESLIFGHVRGAFTGADRRVRGQLELAQDGTLLLDEIAEMPVELQSKLLRVLEDRTFRPLGSEQELPLRARILAATHADVEERIGAGAFREDLFFRLNVVTIHVPTLTEHQDDIPELLAKFALDVQRPLRFTDDAVSWLMARRWPGNVRELRNVVSRLALLADDDTIDARTLEELVHDVPGKDVAAEVDRLARSLLSLPDRLGSKLEVIERAVLHHAIEVCGGNKSAAARLVGVHRKALERRWDRLVDPDSGSGSDEPSG